MLKKPSRPQVFAAAAGAMLVLGLSAPAFAATSTTTGSKVEHGPASSHIMVTDTKCDADSAYGLYKYSSAGEVYRRENDTGCNSVVSKYSDSTIWYIKACRNTTWASDNCDSNWRKY
ncbi:hypothetical protein [Glycomyces paridis]|uniref:Uncharacterized protein n=1 Tax=Glycomyces paridis TaxID=2126555 RepID=A0A4S8PNS2_9ACTN|nr:hypothetical protein [Glycomyces paridis]THV30014.1 hypothetical protein E9998_06415 [Glycomyces paridis]